MPSVKLFRTSTASAEYALIKSILERHRVLFSDHDVNDPAEASRLRRCTSEPPPILLIGRRALTATDVPELESSGELQRAFKIARDTRKARHEYRIGMAHLHGTDGARRDAFAAFEWLRRAAHHGDAKGQAAFATLLVGGQAGVVDEGEATKWYREAAKRGNRSALLALGTLHMQQAERMPEGARNRLTSAVHAFKSAAQAGVADAYVWLAQAESKLDRLAPHGNSALLGSAVAGGAGEGSSLQWRRRQRRDLYAKAAAAGSAHGSFWLAHSLSRGKLPPDPHAVVTAEVMQLLHRAATNGHAAAMFVYGCALLFGHSRGSANATESGDNSEDNRRDGDYVAMDLGADVGAVVGWWVRSAKQGNGAAQAAIGQALLDGLGGIRLDEERTLTTVADALVLADTADKADNADTADTADTAEGGHRSTSGYAQRKPMSKGTLSALAYPPIMPRLGMPAPPVVMDWLPQPANALGALRSVVQYVSCTPRAAPALARALLVEGSSATMPSPEEPSGAHSRARHAEETAPELKHLGRLQGAPIKRSTAADYFAASTANAATAVHERSRAKAGQRSGRQFDDDPTNDADAKSVPGPRPGVTSLNVAGRVAEMATELALANDAQRAYHLFEASAQQGEPAGMVGLADCHLYGLAGVQRDLMVGVAWFAVAAKRRYPRAIVECEALRMAHGAGIIRRSLQLQQVLLATIGRGQKLYRTAKRCYEEGSATGDSTRLRWAAQILSWAARRGEARALVALGKLRLEGAGVSPSTDAAATLFERAAERRVASGASALASLHWEVRGDVFQAFVWFRIAHALGSMAALGRLQQLSHAMHPALTAKADYSAEHWLKQTHALTLPTIITDGDVFTSIAGPGADSVPAVESTPEAKLAVVALAPAMSAAAASVAAAFSVPASAASDIGAAAPAAVAHDSPNNGSSDCAGSRAASTQPSSLPEPSGNRRSASASRDMSERSRSLSRKASGAIANDVFMATAAVEPARSRTLSAARSSEILSELQAAVGLDYLAPVSRSTSCVPASQASGQTMPSRPAVPGSLEMATSVSTPASPRTSALPDPAEDAAIANATANVEASSQGSCHSRRSYSSYSYSATASEHSVRSVGHADHDIASELEPAVVTPAPETTSIAADGRVATGHSDSAYSSYSDASDSEDEMRDDQYGRAASSTSGAVAAGSLVGDIGLAGTRSSSDALAGSPDHLQTDDEDEPWGKAAPGDDDEEFDVPSSQMYDYYSDD